MSPAATGSVRVLDRRRDRRGLRRRRRSARIDGSCRLAAGFGGGDHGCAFTMRPAPRAGGAACWRWAGRSAPAVHGVGCAARRRRGLGRLLGPRRGRPRDRRGRRRRWSAGGFCRRGRGGDAGRRVRFRRRDGEQRAGGDGTEAGDAPLHPGRAEPRQVAVRAVLGRDEQAPRGGRWLRGALGGGWTGVKAQGGFDGRHARLVADAHDDRVAPLRRSGENRLRPDQRPLGSSAM